MPFIEAPTTFYLGRRYDPESKRLTGDVAYYDSRETLGFPMLSKPAKAA